MQELLDKAGNFSRKRHQLGIELESILNPHIGLSLFGKLLFLMFGLPFFIFSAVLTSPITSLSVWLCSKFKDRAFHNAVRYLTVLALFPILFLLIGIVFTALFSWTWGILLAMLFFPSFLFLHEYLRMLRLAASNIKWVLHNGLHKQFKEIETFFNN